MLETIGNQDDTLSFGEVDFQAQALKLNTKIKPNTLILFGGPALGAEAMRDSPTLALDVFCQKFLIWQDAQGKTYLSFNDLFVLAERQEAKKSMALRVINYRLKSMFEAALK